jgi:hypothetical protein
MAAVLYHASPVKNRLSIQTHGLRGHAPGQQLWVRTCDGLNPRGNYGYEDLPGARAFAEGALYQRLGYDQVDIWEFDVSGMNVLFDPEIRDIQHNHHTTIPKWVNEAIKRGKTAPRWYVAELVLPERLKLAETLDWQNDSHPNYAKKKKHELDFAVASAPVLPIWPHA